MTPGKEGVFNSVMMYLYTPGFVNEVDGNVIDTSFCAYFLPAVGFDGSASVGIPGIVFAVSAFVNLALPISAPMPSRISTFVAVAATGSPHFIW